MISIYESNALKRIINHPETWQYLGLQRTEKLSGFFTDFTNSIGSLFTTSNIATAAPLITGGILMLNPHLRKKYALPIIGGALGLAALGNSLTSSNNEVRTAISKGVNSSTPSLMGATVIGKKIIPKSESIGTVLGTVAATGLKVALMQKIAKASQQSGVSQSQLYNQTLAYVTAHQQEFQNAGYSTPNAAAAAILGDTNGYAPRTSSDPCSYIKSLSCEIKGHLPILLLGGVGLLFLGLLSHGKI